MQQFPERVERLGNDVSSSQRRHKVVIATPAREQMPVEMAWHAGAGHTPQVEPYVKPFSLHSLLQHSDQPCELMLYGQVFDIFQIRQLADMPQRGNQQMTVLIRITVEHHQTVGTSVDNQIFTIMPVGQSAAEEAVGIGTRRPLDGP